MSDALPVQVDYTSRDYTSIRQDLIAQVKNRIPEWDSTYESDFGLALVEAFAYMGDLMSYYVDRAANESTLTTATRRVSVVNLARDLGYQPYGYKSATTTLTFTNNSDTDIVIPEGTQVSANIADGTSVINVPFTTDTEITVPATGSQTVQATQGNMQYGNTGFGEYLGVSDGSPSQAFTLPTYEVVLDTLQVYLDDLVNEVAWEKVGNYTEYGPLARVYEVFDNGQDQIEVLFGDGVSGLVPPAGHYVLAVYRTTAGSAGNVPAGSIRNIDDIPTVLISDLPALSSVLSVINDVAATGGVDPESTDSIRRSAPRAYRSYNRLVTRRDYEDASLSVANCGKASAEAASTTSVVIAVAPYRDASAAELTPGIDSTSGSPVATLEMEALKAAVQEYLDSIKLVGTAVAVVNPIYVPIVIEVSVTVADNVRQSDAEVLIAEAIGGRFDYADVPFGAAVYPSDLVSLITQLGDLAQDVTVDALYRDGGAAGLADIVQAELDEILVLDPASLTVNVTGGIS